MLDLRLHKIILLLLCATIGACDRDRTQEAEDSTRLIPESCWFEIGDSWPPTRCFTMEVPENYAEPEGRKIRFPVVRFTATDPDPKKLPLLHLGAGGPGASMGLEKENASEWLWINYAEMTVDNGRDLILIDPRGTGMARPRLTCDEFIEDATTAFQRNLSSTEEARVFTFSMERCYSRLSKTADLAQYNSAAVARDVEALRRELGMEKLNLYGVSYASRYALTLARDYADSVRALVLNSAVFPDIRYTQQLAEDSLEAYARGFQYCIADKQCKSRYPDLKQRLENLVQSLDENPLTIPVKHRFSREEYPFVLTGQRLLRVLFQALYDENFYSQLPQLIEALENGEVGAARAPVAKYMEVVLDPYFGDAAGASHFCYEEAPFVDFNKARAGAAGSGILGGAVRSDIELMRIQCRIWAIPSASLLESRAVETPLPVLVLHGGLDPVLDADNADKARRKLPNHQWLLFPKLAHDTISASNCAEQAAARFLDNPQEDQREMVEACRKEELARQKPAGSASRQSGKSLDVPTPVNGSPMPVLGSFFSWRHKPKMVFSHFSKQQSGEVVSRFEAELTDKSRKLNEASGQCICGAVEFIVNGPISSFHICYCWRCRHSTGSAHASNIFTKPENITWVSGQECIQRFELESAKSWAKQFCKVCGSGLPYVNRAGTHLVIPAGSLNSEVDLEPDDKIFCDFRPGWVESIAEKIEFSQHPNKF